MFIYIQYLQVTFMKQLCFPQFSVLSNKVGAIVTTLTMIAKVTTILLGAYYCYNESNAGLFGKIMHTLISHFCAFSFMKHPFSTTNLSCSVTHVKPKVLNILAQVQILSSMRPRDLVLTILRKLRI